MRIGSHKEKISLVHCHAAMTDVLSFFSGLVVMPDLVAGAGIDRPNIIRNGEVQNAIDQQRRRFDRRDLVGLEGPGQGKILNVLRRDLGERTVTSAGIVAVISRPAVGGRMQQHLLIDALRQDGAGDSSAIIAAATTAARNEAFRKFIVESEPSQTSEARYRSGDLAQRLQICHQIVDVVICVLTEQFNMGIHRRVDLVLHIAGPPGPIRARGIDEADGKFVEVCQGASDRLTGGQRHA